MDSAAAPRHNRPMDSLIAAAARALACGDALGALSRVALRDDPPALALRGIAMAQLGELSRARDLLRRAARKFGAREPLSRARCTSAAAEVALASRDLAFKPAQLEAAISVLEQHGDRLNAAHARLVAARRLLLLGRLDDAEGALASLDSAALPSALAALAELTRAEVALRRVRVAECRRWLARAAELAARAAIPALRAEIAAAAARLSKPAARLEEGGLSRQVLLEEVEALQQSDRLVVDGCRRGIQRRSEFVNLARRPVLFSLLRSLAEVWPADLERDQLAQRVFELRQPNESHRNRLRVEIGRLRRALVGIANVEATARGYRLLSATSVCVLAPPVDGEAGALLALLADGQAWSTSALATALGASQRTVQRALSALAEQGSVRSLGRARAQRWLAQGLGDITPILLLPPSV